MFITDCVDAGKDQSIVSNETVILDANASTIDFNGEIKKYRWKQVKPKGQKVKLVGLKTIYPTFIAPLVSEETVLTFRLTTIKKGGYYFPWRTRDEVSITVHPLSTNWNDPYKKKVHTITTDNGLEFAKHKSVTKALKCDFYFCDPYSSWQRGLNENINGLIRQYIPKGSSFENITKKRIKEIENKLNHRPRKTLGWRTPYEVFHEKEAA